MTSGIRKADLETVIRLLNRPDVEELFARASESVMSDERLANTPLPAGLAMRQTEDLLGSVLRLAAVRSPEPDVEGRMYWYSITHEMMWLMGVINRDCTEGSQLHRAIADREGKRFWVRSLVEEAIATSRLDGASIDYDSARELLQMEASPSTDDERVVVNTHRALSLLPRYVDRELTVDLLISTYEQVAKGTQHPPFEAAVIGNPSGSTMTRHEMLERLCALANDESRVYFEHPAVTALLIMWLVEFWQPFPRWNGAISRLLFRQHVLRRHYPVLGFLPLSASVAAWHEGRILPPEVAATSEDIRMSNRRNEADMSVQVTIYLQLINLALQDLRQYMAEVTLRDETMRELLQTDPELNGRQRTILGRALRVPDATFRIRYHQTTHHVAYSTARADLMELEAKGYLQSRQQGKALVFEAVPELVEIILGGP